MSSAPRPFQIGLYFGFGALFLVALFLISNFSGFSGGIGTNIRPVTIWGVLDERTIENRLQRLRSSDRQMAQVRYREVARENFNRRLLNAIAAGEQPDMILVPHTSFVQERTKILPINYEVLPRRTIQDTYVEGFELFARQDGMYTVPFLVDPLMMYWNRDILSNNSIATPPRTWEALISQVVPKVVRRDTSRRVSMSPIAFGEYRNNEHAFRSLSTLLLQSGSTMAIEKEPGVYNITLNASRDGESNPLSTSLQFYTRFGNPSDALYSWSRTKDLDRDEFLAGNLALYFAPISEMSLLRRQNPNLNFAVTTVPQSVDATVQRTYGDLYGFSILRSSDNQSGAYRVAQTLTSAENMQYFANEYQMAPARRSLISQGNSAPALQAAYESALIARGWLNPVFSSADLVFQQAIEDILADRRSISQVRSELSARLRNLY
jgi:ABC-type glycerol-3-phosphate transport system substrate-binding protein